MRSWLERERQLNPVQRALRGQLRHVLRQKRRIAAQQHAAGLQAAEGSRAYLRGLYTATRDAEDALVRVLRIATPDNGLFEWIREDAQRCERSTL